MLHVRVSGIVQGVGFRWFVRERARRLGLAGWVRNEPDGSVLIAASGSADALVALRRAILEGPPGARVDELRDLAPPGAGPELPDPFTILK